MASLVPMIDRTSSLMLLILVMTAVVLTTCSGARELSNLREAEIQRHLKRLNKPAVKSIKSPDGDIIDCVHIRDQPAFDHPLLKNHTIQMRPSSFPKDLSTGNTGSSNTRKQPKEISQLWHANGRCPENTIPIRRTTKEDLLRWNSIETYGRKNPNSFPVLKPQSATDPSKHEYAAGMHEGGNHGGGATMNIWKPKVESDEFSVSQIWIVDGDPERDLNSIEAGWQVYPQMYGDDNPRFFIYWTVDAYISTGCYNLVCSGFVQTNKDVTLGGTIGPISTYDNSVFDITMLMWKHPDTGDWWLNVHDDVPVGYWPNALFTYLTYRASTVKWGGEIANMKKGWKHTTTEMGSGHFAEEGFDRASYFKHVVVVDESNTKRSPRSIEPHVTQETCYNFKTGSLDPNFGTYFYFGGPGRNPKCP